MNNPGRFLFRFRSSTPIPVIALYVFFARTEFIPLIAGVALMLAGECARIFSASFIGNVSRTRGGIPGELVETGPYAVTRNPLYTANFFIFFGFLITSNNFPYILAASFLLFLQYHFIIRWEEGVLAEKYGARYLEYKNRTRGLFPRLKDVFNRENYRGCDMAAGARSERWTFATLLVLTALPIFCYFKPLSVFS